MTAAPRNMAILRRFAGDRRGVSAVEFALLAPMMIALYLGCVEVSDGVSADRKVSLTASTVANLTSQVSSITNADMTNILNASSAIIAPCVRPVTSASPTEPRTGVSLGAGSTASCTSIVAGGASAGDLWLAHAVRWLAGKSPPSVAVAARPPDQVRLVMTSGQRRAVIALCTAGIPLAWILLGGGLLLLRRRRA